MSGQAELRRAAGAEDERVLPASRGLEEVMSAKKKLCGNLTCVSRRASGMENQTWVEGTLTQ